MSVQGVYIAYPIDQRVDDDGMLYNSIEQFEKSLLSSGAAGWVFDPGDAFKVGKSAVPDDSLASVNRAALAAADVVAAFLPKGIATVGVPIEIDRALRLGKGVVVFSDVTAWMLTDPHIRRYHDWNDATLIDAVDYVVDLEVEGTRSDPYPLQVVADTPDLTPTRAYQDDAGWDLYVSQDTAIAPGAFCDVPCGLRAALPPWAWGLVTGRSSALRRYGLLVHSGVIDTGYRGPLFAGAFNLTDQVVELKAGERIAQLIVMPNATLNTEVMHVDALPVSERGEKGFGSSG